MVDVKLPFGIFPVQMRRRIETKEPVRPFVFLYKIDFPEMQPKKIRLPKTMAELLTQATSVLELNRPAKQVFDDLGEPFFDCESIPPRAQLYISCAAPQNDDVDEPVYKSRRPLKNQTKAGLTLPPVKQPKVKAKPDDAAEHQAVASAPLTVKENMRNALLTLYTSLTPDQRAALPAATSLDKLTCDSQLFGFERQLAAQFIGPNSSIWQTESGMNVMNFATEEIKGKRPGEFHYSITGPSRSGKSTLLWAMVTTFFQKLQISGDIRKYLVVPINWSVQQLVFTDLPKFYALFVTSTISALKNVRIDLLSVADTLQQWFLSIISLQAMPLLPPCLIHMPGFPKDLVASIGQRVHKAWSNKKSGLYNFLATTVDLPQQIANVFDFESVVYVYDHFDETDVMIAPVEHFGEKSEPVPLPELLCGQLSQAIYFVAAKDDSRFMDVFSCDDGQTVTTERIMSSDEEKEIRIAQPSLIITYEMCHGCPGYCVMFNRIFETIKNNQKILKPQFTRLRSVVATSRKQQLKSDIYRLCRLLSLTDTDNIFDDDLMNDLQDMDELEVHVH